MLGWRGPSGQKADKGTIVHKVLEILAVIKKAQQDGLLTITDEIIGELDVSKYNLDKIIDQVYQYYTSQFKHHDWKDKDQTDCYNWYIKLLIIIMAYSIQEIEI